MRVRVGTLKAFKSRRLLRGVLIAACLLITLASHAQADAMTDDSCFAAGVLLFCALMLVAIAIDHASRSDRRMFDPTSWRSTESRGSTFRDDRAWMIPPSGLSGRARAVRDRQAESERAAAAREVSEAVRASLEAAARLLVQHAGIWAEDESALLHRCVQDRAFARRLYRAAARRLHPDRNGGRQSPEWTHLQIAVARLREYQDVEAAR